MFDVGVKGLILLLSGRLVDGMLRGFSLGASSSSETKLLKLNRSFGIDSAGVFLTAFFFWVSGLDNRFLNFRDQLVINRYLTMSLV